MFPEVRFQLDQALLEFNHARSELNHALSSAFTLLDRALLYTLTQLDHALLFIQNPISLVTLLLILALPSTPTTFNHVTSTMAEAFPPAPDPNDALPPNIELGSPARTLLGTRTQRTLRKILRPLSKGASLICRCTFCCLCLPCLCVFFAFRGRYHPHPYHYTRQPPRPLPTRRRALSLPPSPSRSPLPPSLPLPPALSSRTRALTSHTHNTTTPPPLLALPAEIRLQIYNHLLPPRTLSIAHMRKRMLLRGEHTYTVPLADAHPQWNCMSHTPYPPPPPPPPSPLPWLQSCRQIYREAIPLLYRSTTFELRAPELLPHLLARTYAPRHAEIRSLRVCIAGYGTGVAAPEVWPGFWEKVGKGLKGVKRVEIMTYPQVVWGGDEGDEGKRMLDAVVAPLAEGIKGVRGGSDGGKEEGVEKEEWKKGLAGVEECEVRILNCWECIGWPRHVVLQEWERGAEKKVAEAIRGRKRRERGSLEAAAATMAREVVVLHGHGHGDGADGGAF